MRAEAGTSANNSRVYSFSYLRAAACFAIVLLHTVFCAVSLFPEEASATQALLSNIVVNNMMWAVPCFLMVSGALLLNPERPVTVKKCLTKYIPRMLIALVVFCLLFRALEILVNHEPVNAETLLSGFYEIFSGTSWSHVWYLYLMIGIYLLLPFYHKIASNSTAGELRYLMIVYVIFLSLVPVLKTFGISVGFLYLRFRHLPVLPLLRLRIAAGRVARESRVWPAVSPHRHSGGRPVHRAERKRHHKGRRRVLWLFFHFCHSPVHRRVHAVWLRGRQNRRTAKRKISRRFRQVRFGD